MIHMKYFHKKKKQSKINTEARQNNGDRMETRAKSCLKVNTQCARGKMKKINCYGCRETLTTSHTDSVHQQLKPHKCRFCAKIFSQKGNLNRHVDMVHNNLKKHVCPICNKGFSTKQVLTNHTNRYH